VLPAGQAPVNTKPIAARCRHFGHCGGCALQDREYSRQLELKTERVAALLEPVGLKPSRSHGSPQAWFYRNKMEFSFGDVYPPVEGGPTVKLGLKPKGRWYEILDLAECFLLSEETPALLNAVRDWAEREKMPPYNLRKHRGLLRHLVVREGKNTGERMVLLVTAPGVVPTESFVEAVTAVYPATTILRGVNGKLSDTAHTEAMTTLTGPGTITEKLRFPGQEIRLRVSPGSFFQTNTAGTELLYGILRQWAKEAGAKVALDLYCGGGGIGLSLTGVCEKVVGAEITSSAVADARANAELNGVRNAQFFVGQVETMLPSLLAFAPDLVVVDPPRAGLHAKALETLLSSDAPDVFYVSCNPESLARDMAKLVERYSVVRCEVVDLFPHTEHVETVVWLKRL
jgi:23S rRNA (uracil1939-C5)-methyltransferase